MDVFGHAALSGTAKVLEGLVKERIGCKVRSIELNLMQRCASHLASANDLSESRMLGMTAADRAISGVSGQMAVVLRDSDEPYRVHYSTVDIAEVANLEKKVPDNWINAGGNDVTESAPTGSRRGFRFDEQRRSGSSQPLFRRKIILFLVIPPGEEKGSTPFPPPSIGAEEARKNPQFNWGSIKIL